MRFDPLVHYHFTAPLLTQVPFATSTLPPDPLQNVIINFSTVLVHLEALPYYLSIASLLDFTTLFITSLTTPPLRHLA